MEEKKYILAFDTANEQITIALGEITQDALKLSGSCIKSAHRQSNTELLPQTQKLIENNNIDKSQIKFVAVGRGPGSFTGVRIALASAKGISAGLNIPIIGFNTLDAVALNAWNSGLRGHIYVVADAMRNEIYPAFYESTDTGIKKLSSTKVDKAQKVAEETYELSGKCDNFYICGDALHKYFDLFEGLKIADQELWTPSAQSLLLSVEDKLKDNINITKSQQILPVYTRLSDAEEAERQRLATNAEKNLISGVQDIDDSQITYKPLSKNEVPDIAKLESELMKDDAWNSNMINADYILSNRSWWVAVHNNSTVGYAGTMHADNNMEILKIAVARDFQKQGIAKQLLSLCANDMRDLGAQTCFLEVRKSNKSAIKFYEHLGIMQISLRKKYYSNGEDAIIMKGNLPLLNKDIAGMNVQSQQDSSPKELKHPMIFSIESSCDETACAITCNCEPIADAVTSQIDFHKRFGGVVPEIASRKHIESICALAQICLLKAQQNLSNQQLSFKDMDAIAVTYAPGLVGALVVGHAFAKGLAFSIDKPLICINHLEGHLYANKLSNTNIKLPAIASIISGGNTVLIEVKDWGKYKTLGTTIDDAVGEAFDKISKYLGLGYPGGPIISKLAKDGNPRAIDFPRAMMHTDDYQFSLSGLKTAVINYIEKHHNDKNFNLEDLCASFEQAIIDVQVEKARKAIKETSAKSFLFGGGVAANPELRYAYEKMCKDENVDLVMAPLSACGDNAVMIGLVANDLYKQEKFAPLKCDVSAHAALD